MIDSPTQVLTRRMRIAFILCFAPILLFALADLRLEPGRLALFWMLKLVAVLVLVAAFATLRPPRDRGTVVTIGLLTVTAMYVISCTSAVLANEPLTTPLLGIIVALGAATLLPWGVLPQLALICIAIAANVVTVYLCTGSVWPLVSYPDVGIAIGLGMSVYVASELEHTRKRLARHDDERARAEQRVNQLNVDLERRVAERTAELERVNRVLEKEVALHRQAKAEVTALVDNANDAIWSVDRSYHLIAFNSLAATRYARLFGRPLAIGKRVDQRLSPEWEETWKRLYDRAFAGERFTVEHEVAMPEGPRCFAAWFNPIVSDGEVTGATVFSADVTERKQAEESERRHQAELTHVLRLATMGEMAAGLAHEINQPLAAMVNFARGCSLRLREAKPNLPEVLRVLDLIASEALRAGEVIRHLRRLVRREAPRREIVDINGVVEDVVLLLQPEARQHGVVVDVRPDESAPSVLGDPIQIEQILINLIRNGIEAMAESVTPRRLIVEISRTASQVEVTVEDTGPGLAGVEADRAFDAFFTTKPNGLGMGLSISRTIARAHDGRLTAEPCATGARFRLSLPSAPARSPDAPLPETDAAALADSLVPHSAPEIGGRPT
jgi:PAS domain S-box-containing protein